MRCPGPGGPPTANIVAEKVGVYPLKPGGTTGSNNPVRLRIWNYFLDPSQDRIGRFLSRIQLVPGLALRLSPGHCAIALGIARPYLGGYFFFSLNLE